MDLKTIATACLSAAQKISAAGKECVPIFFMFKDGAAPQMMPVPNYAQDREFHLGLMRGALEVTGADCFIFIMEAWLSKPLIDRNKKPGEYLRPSQDPNRLECICVHGGTRSGEEICLMVEINRQDGKVSFSEPWDLAEKGAGKNLMSVMSNMFGSQKAN